MILQIFLMGSPWTTQTASRTELSSGGNLVNCDHGYAVTLTISYYVVKHRPRSAVVYSSDGESVVTVYRAFAATNHNTTLRSCGLRDARFFVSNALLQNIDSDVS